MGGVSGSALRVFEYIPSALGAGPIAHRTPIRSTRVDPVKLHPPRGPPRPSTTGALGSSPSQACAKALRPGRPCRYLQRVCGPTPAHCSVRCRSGTTALRTRVLGSPLRAVLVAPLRCGPAPFRAWGDRRTRRSAASAKHPGNHPDAAATPGGRRTEGGEAPPRTPHLPTCLPPPNPRVPPGLPLDDPPEIK
ncbi:hypothetical protein ES703_61546 [subsurface metagenome]